MEENAIALAWYSEEEYVKFKLLSADPEIWHESYDAWRENAEETIRILNRDGANVTRVLLIFSEVQQWCAMSGRENNSPARSEYAATKLRLSSNPST